MLRLPGADLQQIVGLVFDDEYIVLWADGADEKKMEQEHVIINLKSTCKAMKKVVSDHGVQKRLIAFKVFLGLFNRL